MTRPSRRTPARTPRSDRVAHELHPRQGSGIVDTGNWTSTGGETNGEGDQLSVRRDRAGRDGRRARRRSGEPHARRSTRTSWGRCRASSSSPWRQKSTASRAGAGLETDTAGPVRRAPPGAGSVTSPSAGGRHRFAGIGFLHAKRSAMELVVNRMLAIAGVSFVNALPGGDSGPWTVACGPSRRTNELTHPARAIVPGPEEAAGRSQAGAFDRRR